MSFLDRLASEDRLELALERLAARRARGGRMRELSQRGVSLDHLLLRSGQVVRRLGKELRRGAYEPVASRIRRVVLDKPRDLYTFEVLDLVVHGAFASLLTESMEPTLSPRLYSYRRGRSTWMAIGDLAAYVREHRRSRPDVRTRGLYVFRGDVRSYGDSISMRDGAPVWGQVGEVLGVDESDPGWPLVRRLVQPEVERADGTLSEPECGVPTGSPVATALANLHLRELDQTLSATPGGFYARYSDDIVFAHPDPETARHARGAIDSILGSLGLELNRDKVQDLFFNGAGRSSDERPGVPGTSVVTYVGCDVHFQGTVGLCGAMRRKAIREIRRRVRQADRLLGHRAPEERGPLLCDAVNAALDPRNDLAITCSPLLRSAVTDRTQLRDLDYWVARSVSETLSHRRGARCFRDVPYHKLRDEWGLRSLVVQRNGRGRPVPEGV